MLRSLYLFFLVFSIEACFAQQANPNKVYSELREWGLKGDIRKVTVLIYDSVRYLNGKWVPNDTSQWRNKNIVYHDKDGNTEKVVNISKTESTDFDTTTSLYNANGNESVTIKRGKIINRSKKEWTGTNVYTWKIFDPEGQLLSKTTTILDKDFRVVSEEFESYDNTDTLITYRDITEFNFDSNNRLEKITITDKLAQKVIRINFNTDLAFDNQDNAIKSLKRKEEKKLIRNQIIVRQYEYF